MNAYVFQAAYLCEACGRQMKAELDKAKQEDTGDSGDYPQGPHADGGGEADTPQHCDYCNVFLENPLTSDGYDYIREAIERDADDGRWDSVSHTEWAPFYGHELKR